MPDNETKPPELAVLDPHYVRNLWAKNHPENPIDFAKVNRIRAEIAAGAYPTEGQVDAAIDAIIEQHAPPLPATVDKGDLCDTLAKRMAEEAEDETPVREWDGGE